MRKVVSAGVIALLTLVLLEGALRLYDPGRLRLRGTQIMLPVGGRFEVTNPDDPKLDRVVSQQRNALGFRGPEVPADFASRLTMVTIGGSTTECIRQPDDKTWPAVMARTLSEVRPDVWVNNAGLAGHSTFGHLAMLNAYIRPLRPRVAIYLVGINDVGYTMDDPFHGWRGRIANYSAAANLLWNLERLVRARHLAFDGTPIDPLTAEHREMSDQEIAKALADDTPHVEGFRMRLSRLVDETVAAGIEPILVTQPMLGGDLVDPATNVSLATIMEEQNDLNGIGSWRRLERYNDVTRSVAASRGIGLVDLARELPKDSRLFIDFIHFSNDGAAAVGRIMGAALAARFGAAGGI